MKKFRYEDTTKITKAHRLRGMAVLFVCWNLMGYGIWKFLSGHAAKRDPDWEKRPDDERIAIVGGVDPKNVRRFEINLFGRSDKEKSES